LEVLNFDKTVITLLNNCNRCRVPFLAVNSLYINRKMFRIFKNFGYSYKSKFIVTSTTPYNDTTSVTTKPVPITWQTSLFVHISAIDRFDFPILKQTQVKDVEITIANLPQ